MQLAMQSVKTYDLNNKNFSRSWWNHPRKSSQDGFYSWWFNEIEIARVHISFHEDYLQNGYQSLRLKGGPVYDISFFEVNRLYRRKGYGSRAIELLGEQYHGKLLSAFAVDSDAAKFWGSLKNWSYHPRLDGDTSCLKLFVFSAWQFATAEGLHH